MLLCWARWVLAGCVLGAGEEGTPAAAVDVAEEKTEATDSVDAAAGAAAAGAGAGAATTATGATGAGAGAGAAAFFTGS